MNDTLILEGLKILLLGCSLAFFTSLAIKVMLNFFIPRNAGHERKIRELLSVWRVEDHDYKGELNGSQSK